MMKPSISVIIPVYNVAPWLCDCLSSVLNQTLKSLEIIIVDDGSTDISPQIIAEYAAKDSRVKVITQKNSGLGAARNTGIINAAGEYLAFLDSDDRILPNTYEKLYEKALAFDCDIVFCQASYLNDATGVVSDEDNQTSLPLFKKIKQQDDSFSVDDFTPCEIFSYDSFVVAWNKITKRELINQINARFPEKLIFEDMPFYFHTLLNSDRIAVVWERLVHYRINRNNSITFSNARDGDIFNILNIIANQLSATSKTNSNRYRVAASSFAYKELCYKIDSIIKMNLTESDFNMILLDSDRRNFINKLQTKKSVMYKIRKFLKM